jgi:hypothetical protein
MWKYDVVARHHGKAANVFGLINEQHSTERIQKENERISTTPFHLTPSPHFNPLLTHENSQLCRADFEIDVSCRWVYRSRRSHDAPSLNRHRPGRNPRTFLFVLEQK